MNKSITGIICLVFITALIVTGCYYDNEESLYPQVTTTCDTTNVTYSRNITVVLSNNCLGCHGATYKADGDGIKLDTYTDLKPKLDRVIGAITHDSHYAAMPKDRAKLSDCQISQFQIWKRNGAPEN